MPNPIFFNQLSISMNLYQHAKNQVISSFCSRYIIDLIILQSDWLRASWPISQEPQEFSQICDLCRNTTNKTKFRNNNDQISQQIPKTSFLAHIWPISPIVLRKNIFFNSTWTPNTMLNFRKS